MRNDCLIGVDLGTTLAKAGVYDTDGNLLGSASVATELHYPRPEVIEQDPEEFYRSALTTIRGAMEKSGIDAGRVAALCISSQAGGIMGIDRDWQPVTPFDSPLDTRSNPQKQRMMSVAGRRIMKLSGAPPTYGQKILRWKHEEPEVWQKIYRFIQPAAYVAGRLADLRGDKAFMEPTFMCWSGLADSANGRWSEELCDAFGVPAQVLPRVAHAFEIAGHLTAAAAADSGLPSGLPIAVGTADAAATLLGAGIVDAGALFDISGTACIFGVCADRFISDSETMTFSCMNSALPGKFFQLAIVLGGETHAWFTREFCDAEMKAAAQAGTSVFEVMDAKAASLPPGSDGVLCSPHLGGRWNPPEPDARGLWLGFGWGHRKEHLYRALLESIAYEYAIYLARAREMMPQAEFGEVCAMGGGARSRLWTQIKSDVLGMPYRTLAREELTTWGSALIAGRAVGIFPDLAAAAPAHARTGDCIEPDHSAQRAYRKYTEIYSRLFATNRETFSALAKSSQSSA